MRVYFRGKAIALTKQRRRLPNGRLANIEIIEHPGAVLIVPFLSKNEIVFLHQYRPVIKSYLYELPAGTLNKNETPWACAHRELVEETGYRAKRLTRVGRIYPVPGYSTELITVFKAEHLIPDSAQKDFEEIILTKVFKKSEIKKLFNQGKIIDAKTICGFVFCGWL